jgi:hypothetical protein
MQFLFRCSPEPKLDRLSRSLKDLLAILERIEGKQG